MITIVGPTRTYLVLDYLAVQHLDNVLCMNVPMEALKLRVTNDFPNIVAEHKKIFLLHVRFNFPVFLRTLFNHYYLIIVFFGFECFSNPTSPPRSPIGSVPCVPSYTLCSPAFKGVTRGMNFKHTSPPLCYPWYTLFRYMSQPLKSTPAPMTGSPQHGCQPPAGGQFNDLSRSPLFHNLLIK